MKFLSKLFSRHDKTPAKTVEQLVTTEMSRYRQLKKAGNDLLDQGKFEEAAVVYKTALDENPSLSEAHVNYAYVLGELSRVDEAKEHYDRAVALDNNNFDAQLLRAMLAVDQGDLNVALVSIQNAIRIKPESPEAIDTLYRIYALRGKFDQIDHHINSLSVAGDSPAKLHVDMACVYAKIKCEGDLKNTLNQMALDQFKVAIDLDPNYAEIYNNQGLVLMSLNKPEQAIQSFKTGMKIKPDSAEAYYYLGSAYKAAGQFDLAITHFETSGLLNPKHAAFNKSLADIYYQLGDFDKAASFYKSAILIDPDLLDCYILLGSTLGEQGKHKEAYEYLNTAIKLRKDAPEIFFTMGNVLLADSQYHEAIENYQKAIRLRPDYLDAKNNLASSLLGTGNFPAALEMYRSIAKEVPSRVTTLSNIVYCSSFDSDCTPEGYLRDARTFGSLVSKSAKPYTSWSQCQTSDRCLKVGLVSGDFCHHPVGFFLESVLAYLDADTIEIHAFSNRTHNDEIQNSLKSRVKTWTSIMGISDEAAAKLIYDMQLDVLIDLSGHTNHNRLPIFAWRPAPVQATWLGYWGSTGVAEMDYILADRQTVPPEHQGHFTEKVWYLPDTRLCFTPPSAVYDWVPTPPPSSSLGYVTFGCYQPIRKLTDNMFALWGKIHQQLPQTHFRLQGTGFTTPAVNTDLLRRLEDAGVPRQCVSLNEIMGRNDYLKSHAEVDMILDTFPYPGGTTTCDALWMGVPTLTLAGKTMLSRQGVSLLMCAGLPDWIAQTEDEYVEIAVNQASDLKRLSHLRSSLRQQVFETPLFSAPRFASDLEVSLRTMIEDKQDCKE